MNNTRMNHGDIIRNSHRELSRVTVLEASPANAGLDATCESCGHDATTDTLYAYLDWPRWSQGVMYVCTVCDDAMAMPYTTVANVDDDQMQAFLAADIDRYDDNAWKAYATMLDDTPMGQAEMVAELEETLQEWNWTNKRFGSKHVGLEEMQAAATVVAGVARTSDTPEADIRRFLLTYNWREAALLATESN